MGATHHEPLEALSPVDWADVPQDDLKPFLSTIFNEAHTVVDSIPSTATSAADTSSPNTGRDRSRTSPAAPASSAPSSSATAPPALTANPEQSALLRKEWKEVKVNPRENPMDVKVYKLSSKDGRGAWFARRSIHEGLTFEQWKAGLDREFNESMEVQEGPGSGSIRGIGADKRVEDTQVPDAGHAQVFQLSAQFPGPTSPRDFVTLLLTSDFAHVSPDHPKPLRQYMIVSKPCQHPECPPRQGIIRGQYESVEVIREVPVGSATPVKRSYSSNDVGADQNATSVASKSTSTEEIQPEAAPTAIEWLMVTRSDPGGSVPRFMIEKGTPPGIVNDAGKFLKWVKRKLNDSSSTAEEDGAAHDTKGPSGASIDATKAPPIAELGGDTPANNRNQYHSQENNDEQEGAGAWSSNGLYGMITGAFGAATSVVSGGILRQFSTAEDNASDGSDGSASPVRETADAESSASETSSLRSFTSALEGGVPKEEGGEGSSNQETPSDTKSQEGQSSHQKELRRLEERRRKLDEKAAKMSERLEKQRQGGKERDAAAAAKFREKHEREVAKHEAKYKRELKRVEEKREAEERKAEEKRKKAQEREEKANMSLELERVRAERDVALKQVEMLTSQVGELQALNTTLAAKLGKGANGSHERTSSMSTTSSSAKEKSAK